MTKPTTRKTSYLNEHIIITAPITPRAEKKQQLQRSGRRSGAQSRRRKESSIPNSRPKYLLCKRIKIKSVSLWQHEDNTHPPTKKHRQICTDTQSESGKLLIDCNHATIRVGFSRTWNLCTDILFIYLFIYFGDDAHQRERSAERFGLLSGIDLAAGML
jgi:hypothetical protein